MATQTGVSGVFADLQTGLDVLISQGIAGSTLVAGKQCLFRFWMAPENYAAAQSVVVVVDDGKKPLATVYYRPVLITEDAGPSVGVILRGHNFPRAGTYQVFVSVRDASGALLQQPGFPPMQFAPTQDLRLLIIPLQGSAPTRSFLPTKEWYDDIRESMQRFAVMLPVRDCVGHLALEPNRNRTAGLRYVVGAPLEAWPDEVFASPPPTSYWLGQLLAINGAQGDVDHVDIQINYRPVQPKLNEAPGGIALYMPQNGFPYANVVAGLWSGLEMTAGCVGQEIGHLLGLESPKCPGFEDPANPRHSKYNQVTDPFRFDPLRRFGPPVPVTGDVMNNTGGGVWRGREAAAYSACDWEVIRTALMSLSDQPTGTEINPAIVDPCMLSDRVAIPQTLPKWFINPETWLRLHPEDPYWRSLPSQGRALGAIAQELLARGVAEVMVPTQGDLSVQVVGRSNLFHLTRRDIDGGPTGELAMSLRQDPSTH